MYIGRTGGLVSRRVAGIGSKCDSSDFVEIIGRMVVIAHCDVTTPTTRTSVLDGMAEAVTIELHHQPVVVDRDAVVAICRHLKCEKKQMMERLTYMANIFLFGAAYRIQTLRRSF